MKKKLLSTLLLAGTLLIGSTVSAYAQDVSSDPLQPYEDRLEELSTELGTDLAIVAPEDGTIEDAIDFYSSMSMDEFDSYVKDAYEEAKQLLRDHRQSLDRIAAFLIEKETITGKEFMEIFHEVEGIDPDAPKKEEARIGMNPVEGEGFVMKSADDTAEEPVEAIKEVVCEEE